MKAQGMGATEIAKTLGIYRGSVYRLALDGAEKPVKAASN
jgi:hypothetical protein